MNFYEIAYIAKQDMTGDKLEMLAKRFEKVVKDFKGKILKREDWGLRNLAYRIQKNRKGHYMMLNVEAPATAVAELDRLMRLDEEVIRHLILKLDAPEEGPSAILQYKNRETNTLAEFDVETEEK